MRPIAWATRSAGAIAFANGPTVMPSLCSRQAPTARPDGEHPVPDVRDVVRRGDFEVNAAADDARGHDPQRDVVDQVRVAAEGAPEPPGDQDRQGDPDDGAARVEVDLQRADVEGVTRRAGDELRERGYALGHAPETIRQTRTPG